MQDNCSKKRAQKATPAPRRALGRSMEAKLSKMKQTANTIDFPMVSDDFWGELARQRLQKESPKSHDSPEESSWRKYGSKMEQNEANWNTSLIFLWLLMIFGVSSQDNCSKKRAQKATTAPRRALGGSVEAKWSKMKQPAKIIDFPLVFDDFGGEFARQRLQKESPKSPDSPEDSFWNKHGSKIKQIVAKS